MESPHGAYYGHRYCPNEPGALSYEEWKEQKKQEMKNKKKP